MKKLVLGLMTIAALGTFSMPTMADEANVQNSSQVSTQEGEGNTSYQRSSQRIRTQSNELRNRSGRRSRNSSSTGNVQDIGQDSFQSGYDNLNVQDSRQRIDTRRNNVDLQPRRRNRRRNRSRFY